MPGKLTGERPPYKFCWWCSRQFYGGKGVKVTVAAGVVWVHHDCKDAALRG